MNTKASPHTVLVRILSQQGGHLTKEDGKGIVGDVTVAKAGDLCRMTIIEGTIPCELEDDGWVLDDGDYEIVGDGYSSLRELGHEIVAINTANGWNVPIPADWNDTYKVPALLALIHSEVSEAVEAFRVRDLANFAEELADVLIRVLDLAAGLSIDMDAVLRAKIEYNKTRE